MMASKVSGLAVWSQFIQAGAVVSWLPGVPRSEKRVLPGDGGRGGLRLQKAGEEGSLGVMPDEPPESTTTSAVHLRLVLWRAAKAVEEVDLASVASTGLGLSDFAVLEVLLNKGAMRVNDVGKKVLLTSGSISVAVDRLEKRGLVERRKCEKDRRVCYVDLTGEGRVLINAAFREHAGNLERAMEFLSGEEKGELVGLLRKLGKGVLS